jgi:DNA-binding beta-propeller fold protein YncE
VFVYARTGHAVATLGDERTFYHGGSRLFQFDQAGKFVKEIGQGVYGVNFAQQVRVDPQDNVWIVDAGSNQVFKFDPDGKMLLVLGRKPESISLRPGPGVPARAIDIPKGGAAPEAGRGEGRGGGGGGGRGGGAPGAGPNGDNFNRPSDVTWDKAGNVYVADGYGTNNRIAKFTREGNFVKTWGQTGSGQGQFNGIRGLAIDAAGNLYVADAGNKRIQVFDGEGTFKSQMTNIGTPQAICISGGSTQYLYSSNSNDLESMEGGEIYKLQLNGQVVGKFGKAGKLVKEFGVVNAIDCRTENNLWIGEVLNWRAQRVTLKP